MAKKSRDQVLLKMLKTKPKPKTTKAGGKKKPVAKPGGGRGTK